MKPELYHEMQNLEYGKQYKTLVGNNKLEGDKFWQKL